MDKKPDGLRGFEIKYELIWPWDEPCHVWSLVGAAGGVHCHLRRYRENEWTGGIELHSRTPLGENKHKAPSQKDCHLIGGPCWHDGSSLAAEGFTERLRAGETAEDLHWSVFSTLLSWYRDHFMQEPTNG